MHLILTGTQLQNRKLIDDVIVKVNKSIKKYFNILMDLHDLYVHHHKLLFWKNKITTDSEWRNVWMQMQRVLNALPAQSIRKLNIQFPEAWQLQVAGLRSKPSDVAVMIRTASMVDLMTYVLQKAYPAPDLTHFAEVKKWHQIIQNGIEQYQHKFIGECLPRIELETALLTHDAKKRVSFSSNLPKKTSVVLKKRNAHEQMGLFGYGY